MARKARLKKDKKSMFGSFYECEAFLVFQPKCLLAVWKR